jgi:hypothetical protein
LSAPRCWPTGIDVFGDKAVAVRTASGRTIRAAKAIVADTAASTLYRELLWRSVTPEILHADLDRFEWDLPTVKINYRLSSTPSADYPRVRQCSALLSLCSPDRPERRSRCSAVSGDG